MAGYITQQELLDASVDAGTLESFVNGENGVPNINRDGENVGNLQTLTASAMAAAAAAAELRTYLTRAAMNADTSRPVGTTAQVVADPTPANNQYYVWTGSEWEVSAIQPATSGAVASNRIVAIGGRFVLHGAATYQRYDRNTACWYITHPALTVFRGAGRGQVTIAAAQEVEIALNRMYYVDVNGAASGAVLTATVTPANADNAATYGSGAFVEDLKLCLFSFRSNGPGGLLFNRNIDQTYGWPAVTPAWFKSSAATVVAYDSESRTLSWNGQIVCPVSLNNTGRSLVMPAFSIAIPDGNYNVVWIDLRKLPLDPATPLDPAVMVKAGAYSEGFSSDTAYRALRHQLPLFAVGNGVAYPLAGFFINQIQGVVYPADTASIDSAVTALQQQVAALEEEVDNIVAPEQSEVSRSPLFLNSSGAIYRFGATGETLVSDISPNSYITQPYWRGSSAISVADIPTLASSTAVAVSVDGKFIHPSPEDLITGIIGHGQSNARGTRGNQGPAIPLDPKYASTMLMFSGGPNMDVRMGIMADDFETPIDASALTGFQTLRSVDTIDNVGTTMLEGMAATIHAKIDTALGMKPTYHYFTAARGGTNLAGISQGTVPYQNLLIGVQRAFEIAQSMGKHYYVAAIAWVHGESDTGNANYASLFMSTFYNPVNAAIKAITGQLNDVQVFAVQPSSFQGFTGILQLRAIEDLTPNYHLVAPTFCMPFSTTDYLHQNRRGQFGNGENLGLAYLDVCAGLRTWEPLGPTSVAFNGTTGVTITFNVPEGNLTLDPVATDKDGNWGFELYTGSTKVDIIDKQLVGNTVVLTAASNLTAGTSVVRYALNGQTNPRTEAAIPRGRLRDGRGIASVVDGRLLYNWCVHFQETI